MITDQSRNRARKNTVTFYTQDGMIRIRFRFEGKLIRKAIGLPDTPENRVKASEIASRVQLAILSGNFAVDDLDSFLFNKPKPVEKPKKKRYSKNSPNRQPFTREEIQTIITAFYTGEHEGQSLDGKFSHHSITHYKYFVHAAFLLGTRPGELLALTWADIDFQANVIRINKAYARGEKGQTSHKHRRLKKPKTESGIRSLPMNEQIRTLFESMDRGKGSDRVFQSPTGKIIDDSNFTQRIWKPLLRKLKIKPRPFYVCRHSRATTMLESGVSINKVSAWLGHSGLESTMHYLHNRQLKKDEIPDL